MSSLETSVANPPGDSIPAAQSGVPPKSGTSQQGKRATAKEEFSEQEIEVLQKHVDQFKESTKAERHKLLVAEVLPKLRTLNLHMTQEKWDLRKTVSNSSYAIPCSEGDRRSSRSKSGFKTTAGVIILHLTCHSTRRLRFKKLSAGSTRRRSRLWRLKWPEVQKADRNRHSEITRRL